MSAPAGGVGSLHPLLLQDVTVTLGGQAVLSSLSHRFEAGQFHALVGASGAGKTTILRVLAGLQPYEGHASIGELEVTPATRRERASRVGYVIQEGGLFPHLTLRQNVALAGAVLGRVVEPGPLLDQLGLRAALWDRHPSELSGGQRQRGAFARALSLDPPVLLLDEPLGAVDPLLRTALQDDLRVALAGRTVLLVTHDLAEAAFLGDTLTVLHAGRIEQSGPVRQVLDAPATAHVSAFLRAHRTLVLGS